MGPKAQAQQEYLARIVGVATERLAKLTEEERRTLVEACRKPPKWWGVCEICGERFAASRSDAKTCDKYRCQKARWRRERRAF
jgi:hypothetical protein